MFIVVELVTKLCSFVGAILSRYRSTSTVRIVNSSLPSILYKPTLEGEKSPYEPNFSLSSLRSRLDLDLPNHPATIGEIGEFPLSVNLRIGEPPVLERKQEDSVPDKTLDLPPTTNVVEKRAERMIVIRRRKMRKHKLKKLRKRMKFFWGKIKQKREMAKEKAFHAELIAQIKKAEAWCPKKFVASTLAKLDEVRIPSKYKGVHLPEAQVKEFMKRDAERVHAKFNKPRLTL